MIVNIRPGPGRPGRRRSEDSRQAILAATLELVAEHGFGGLTVEGIAARSGTGKQTIYRWWPSTADLLLDALATKADLHVPVPDEGSYAGDLRVFLADSFVLGRRRQVRDVLCALMARAQTDPDFGERFRTGFLQRRREALGVILDHARARGDLPPNPPPGTVCDLVFGVIWYRMLATGEELDQSLADDLVATLTAA